MDGDSRFGTAWLGQTGPSCPRQPVIFGGVCIEEERCRTTDRNTSANTYAARPVAGTPDAATIGHPGLRSREAEQEPESWAGTCEKSTESVPVQLIVSKSGIRVTAGVRGRALPSWASSVALIP